MISMEERLNYMDGIMAELAHAQLRTEVTMKVLGEKLDHYGEKLDHYGERLDQFGEKLDHYGERLDQFGERLDQYGDKLEQHSREAREDTRAMKKAWGDLANKMGTVAEDVVAPNIPRLALEEFGFSEVEDLLVRARRASRRGEKRLAEYDIVCSGPGKVIVVDVKSTPTLGKIQAVPATLREFFDFFPEYEGRELIGVFASWAIDTRLLPAISAAGLYGLAMGEDTMDIVARPA